MTGGMDMNVLPKKFISCSGLYSVALFAENEKRFRVNAGSVVATSLDKAKSLGLDKAMQLWPPDDGWYGHQCLEGEVKQEMAGQIPLKEQESDSKILEHLPSGRMWLTLLRRLAKVDTSKIQVVASQVELLLFTIIWFWIKHGEVFCGR